VIRIRQILCPVDFSPFARRALDHAAVLARWYEAELTVLHVSPLMPTLFGMEPAVHAATLAPFDREVLGRELLMNAKRANGEDVTRPLVSECLSIGWGLLAEEPGRELVMGAVTRPWEADVRFWSLPPDEFAAFDAPGYAKIVWTLAAQPTGSGASTAHTETRVGMTDAAARSRFRRYWAVVSPGVVLIRRQSLRIVKADAEQHIRAVPERAN